MSKFTVLKIIITVCLAVAIGVFTNSYLVSLKEETDVLIVTQDLPAGVIVSGNMLEKVSVRKKDAEILFKGALSDIPEMNMLVSSEKIKSGAGLYPEKNIIVGTKAGLVEKGLLKESGAINSAYFLSREKRLLSVRVESAMNYGQKLDSGDFVDVVFTSSDDQADITAMILQHIEVVEVSESAKDGDEAEFEVFLSVSAQEAVELAHAKRMGMVDLVLNPENGYKELVSPVTSKKLIGDSVKGVEHE